MPTVDRAATAARCRRPAVRRSVYALLGATLLAAAIATAAQGSAATRGGYTSSANDLSPILNYIGPVNPKTAGKGLKLKLGVTLSFSGQSYVFSRMQFNGVKLAVQQIKALGGPSFQIITKDNQSAQPAASAKAAKELGLAGIKIGLCNQVAGSGAMLPAIAQYKMLTIDGGAGTSVFAEGKPYFWGARAITPDDAYAGVAKYIQKKFPTVKKISMVAWDLGPLNNIIEDDTRKALAAAGIELVGYETAPIGATDYSTAIQHLRSEGPDALFLAVYGADVGNFMKQYVGSGIGKPVFGFDLTDDGIKAGGSALNGYMYSYDVFDAARPSNPWAKIFVKTYRAAYGEDPTFYAANYYEDTFLLWDLVRRVLAKGGNPNSGTALQNALVASPTFKSVYGGNASRAGVLQFNLTTHSLSRRPIGLFKYDAGTNRSIPLAYFDIGGRDFRLARP